MSSFWQQIILLCAQVLLPVIPSWLMYQAFGKWNVTKYKKGVIIGGPIAAYFVIMLTIFRFTGNINPDLMAYLDAQQRAENAYVGAWITLAHFEDPTTGEAKVGKGKAYIKYSDKSHNLHLSGSYIDDNEIPQSWESNAMVVTDKNMLIIWTTGGLGTFANGASGVGKLVAHYDDDSVQVIEMRGTWGVIGQEVTGSWFFVRERDFISDPE